MTGESNEVFEIIKLFQHKDLARENERAAEIAANIAAQMIDNRAPILRKDSLSSPYQ